MTTALACLMLTSVLNSMPALADVNMKAMCVAGLCLENSESTYSNLRQRVGKGIPRKHKDDANASSFCFFDPQHRVWAEFTFRGKGKTITSLMGITLTTVPICDPKSANHIETDAMVDAVKIGASEQDVIDALGSPSRIDDAVAREREDSRIKGTRYSAIYGDKVLVYERKNDLGFLFVFLKDGHVSTVWASTQE